MSTIRNGTLCWALIISSASAAWCQTLDSTLERLSDLNRSGRWSEAAAQADRFATRADLNPTQRARALCSLVAARARLRQIDEARAALVRLREAVRSLPSDHWIRARAKRLADEVENVPNRTRPGAGSPAIGPALWQMRYASSTGQWEACLDWAARADELTTDDSIGAEIALYRYAAQRHLEHEEEAFGTLQRFKATVGDKHRLALQMHLLRRSLGDQVDDPPAGRVFRPKPDAFWTTASPEDRGLDPVLLGQHLDMCRRSGADAVLVARDGTIVSEWYSPLYDEPVRTMSSVKSITGLLAGALIADGRLGIDDPIGRYVPEWSEGGRARVTVRHLLTMTSGLPRLATGGVGLRSDGDATGYCLGLAPEHEPGQTWAYSNEGVQILSPVLEQAAGMPLWKYAEQRLFNPMGLHATAMRRDSVGNTITYADAETTLREFAKLGQLVLNGGRWRGLEVLPASWIGEMTAPVRRGVLQELPEDERERARIAAREAGSDETVLNPNYGYLWWIYDNPRVVAMQGYLATSVWAFPDLNIVVARVQSRPYLHATERYDPGAMFKLIERAVVDRAQK